MRLCLQCGAPLHGRTDKKFCNDSCRCDFHNGKRREQEKDLRQVNRILAANWRLLSRLLRRGKTEIPQSELAALDFNFEIFTASRSRFLRQRVFWCYNCSYTVSRSGMVRIRRSECRNNAVHSEIPDAPGYARI